MLIKLQKFTTEMLESGSNYTYVCERQKNGSKSAFLSQSQRSINNAQKLVTNQIAVFQNGSKLIPFSDINTF